MKGKILRPDKVTIGVEGNSIVLRHIPEFIPWDAVPAVCQLMLDKAQEAKRNAFGVKTQDLNLNRGARE